MSENVTSMLGRQTVYLGNDLNAKKNVFVFQARLELNDDGSDDSGMSTKQEDDGNNDDDDDEDEVKIVYEYIQID